MYIKKTYEERLATKQKKRKLKGIVVHIAVDVALKRKEEIDFNLMFGKKKVLWKR